MADHARPGGCTENLGLYSKNDEKKFLISQMIQVAFSEDFLGLGRE